MKSYNFYRAMLCFFISISLFTSCSSVKRVLNDPKKFEIVAQETIRRGYCSNDTSNEKLDTTVIIKYRDTTIIDSFKTNTTVYKLPVINQLFKSGSRLIIDSFGKITIHCPIERIDTTIKSSKVFYITDNSRIKLLRDDSSRLTIENNVLKNNYILQNKNHQLDTKELHDTIRKQSLKYWFTLSGFIVLILGFLYFKFSTPLKRIFKWLPLLLVLLNLETLINTQNILLFGMFLPS